MTTFDKRWEENFNVFKEYVNEFNMFPESKTEYKGVKIGNWLVNQRKRAKDGILDQNRLDKLNEFLPVWNGTIKEKDQWYKQRLIDSDWKVYVPEGKTPIDALYQDINNLSRCLKRGIYDCETLLETDKSAAPVYECLSKIYPYLDKYYTKLLCSIFCVAPYTEEAKELFESLVVISSAEMVSKFDDILDTLTEREQKVLRLRYGLDDGRTRTLKETGKLFDLNAERIRQIEAKGLIKLRHPSRKIVLFTTNTILDECWDKLSKVTRTNLYKLGIMTEERLEEYVKGDIPYDIKGEIYSFLYSLKKIKKKKTNKRK